MEGRGRAAGVGDLRFTGDRELGADRRAEQKVLAQGRVFVVGRVIERLDQVFMGRLSLLSDAVCTFFIR